MKQKPVTPQRDLSICVIARSEATKQSIGHVLKSQCNVDCRAAALILLRWPMAGRRRRLAMTAADYYVNMRINIEGMVLGTPRPRP